MSNGNEPAYPIDAVVKAPGVVERYSSPGLTKRELFAMAAMQGLLASPAPCTDSRTFARDAVACADALLAELEKPR